MERGFYMIQAKTAHGGDVATPLINWLHPLIHLI